MDIISLVRIFTKMYKVNQFLAEKAKLLIENKFKIDWNNKKQNLSVFKLQCNQVFAKANQRQSKQLENFEVEKWDISLLHLIFTEGLSDLINPQLKRALYQIRDIRNEICHFSYSELQSKNLLSYEKKIDTIVKSLQLSNNQIKEIQREISQQISKQVDKTIISQEYQDLKTKYEKLDQQYKQLKNNGSKSVDVQTNEDSPKYKFDDMQKVHDLLVDKKKCQNNPAQEKEILLQKIKVLKQKNEILVSQLQEKQKEINGQSIDVKLQQAKLRPYVAKIEENFSKKKKAYKRQIKDLEKKNIQMQKQVQQQTQLLKKQDDQQKDMSVIKLKTVLSLRNIYTYFNKNTKILQEKNMQQFSNDFLTFVITQLQIYNESKDVSSLIKIIAQMLQIMSMENKNSQIYFSLVYCYIMLKQKRNVLRYFCAIIQAKDIDDVQVQECFNKIINNFQDQEFTQLIFSINKVRLLRLHASVQLIYQILFNILNPKIFNFLKQICIQNLIFSLSFKFYYNFDMYSILCILQFVLSIASYPFFGNSTLGYYYIEAFLGNNKERQTLIFDTGSNLLLTDCDQCTHCGQHIDQPYHINNSQSKKDASEIEDLYCEEDKCNFEISYKEGSSYQGIFYQEQISFDKNEQSFYDVIGCIDDETGLFYTQQADGIIGMAMSNMQAPNQYNVLSQNGFLKNQIVSICLGQDGGQYTFEEFNYQLHKQENGIKEIDCQNEQWDTFFITTINNIEIEDDSNDFESKAFFDTGTTLTYFSPEVYQYLIDNINQYCQKNNYNCNGENTIHSCFSTGFLFFKNSYDILNTFPILNFSFNGIKYSWYPQQYFYEESSDYCLGFDQDSDPINTLGANFMSQKDILFDIQNKKIKFNEAKCSQNEINIHTSSHLNQHHMKYNKVSQKFLKYRQQTSIIQRRVKNREIVSLLLILSIVVILMFWKLRKKQPKNLNDYREFFELQD